MTLAIVHQHVAASSKVPDKAAEWVTNSAPANFAPDGFQPSQARVSIDVLSTVAQDRERDIVPNPNRAKESLLAHTLGRVVSHRDVGMRGG